MTKTYSWKYCKKCNEKGKRIKTNKYIISIILFSIVCFVASIIGIKLANLYLSDEKLVNFVVIFIGLFSLISFGFVVVWTLLGTIVGVFPLFLIGKNKKSLKIISIILTLCLLSISVLSFYYFAIILKKFFVDNFDSTISMEQWFNNLKEWFTINLANNENKNFIILFSVCISWTIVALTYKIIYQLSIKSYDDKKNASKISNPTTSPTIKPVSNNEETKKDSLVVEENKTIIKEEPNEKVLELVEEKKVEVKEDNDWLLSPSNDKNDNKPEEQNEAPKIKHDPNDPASIFD